LNANPFFAPLKLDAGKKDFLARRSSFCLRRTSDFFDAALPRLRRPLLVWDSLPSGKNPEESRSRRLLVRLLLLPSLSLPPSLAHSFLLAALA
jgi:hypothetical protein